MTNLSPQLERIRSAALKCECEITRARYISAADSLIGAAQRAGEISETEASDMAREWVSAYACGRGMVLAAIGNNHLQ